MDEAERQAVWLGAFGEAMRVGLRAGLPPRPPDPVVYGEIDQLRRGAHQAMDEATNDAARNAAYERHRALSAVLRELRPQDPGV